MDTELEKKKFKFTTNEIAFSIIIVLLIVVIIIIVTKKGDKLECTRTGDNTTVSSKEVITSTFKKKNLATIKFHYKTTVKPDNQYMLDQLYGQFEIQLNNLKNAGGYDFTLEKGNDYIEYTSTADINSIPEESALIIGYDGAWTYKDVKADLERNGFKCK